MSLGRNTVFVGELLQGRFPVRQPPSCDDRAAAIIEGIQRIGQLCAAVHCPVVVFSLGCRLESQILKVAGRCRPVVFRVVLDERIERCVMGAQPLLHLGDDPRLDAQILRDGFDLGAGHPAQPLPGAAQIEEQLALRLGRSDLDDPPVSQDELVDLGLDPVHRKGDEAYADAWIVALDRLHQPDIAFLDEIRLRKTVSVIAPGDTNHEAQVRGDQLPRRIKIAFRAISLGQLSLLLRAEHRERENRLSIRGQVPDGDRRDRQLQCCAHFTCSMCPLRKC